MIRPRFVLFGDSLTQRSFDEGGWGAALASTYQRRVDVLNRGYSGYTTRWVRPLLPAIFPENDPSPPLLATVFLGANDAAIEGRASARQHVPVKEYGSNLRAIVDHMKGAGVRHVVVLTPPPLDEERRVAELKARDDFDPSLPVPERTNEVTAQYAAAAREVAAATGALLLDLFDELQKEEGWQARYLNDGLHFTPEGQRRVAQLLQALIDERLPELRAHDSTLPFDFPPHNDLEGDGYGDVIAQWKK